MGPVFDSTKYLEAWRTVGVWPKIHDEICGLIQHTTPAGASVLDLCCSTGILPQRLQDQSKLKVCGIEWVPEAIDSGRSFGIDIPVLNERISRVTLPAVRDWVEEHQVTVVSARRCLSELAVPPTRPNGPHSTETVDFEFSVLLFGMFADAGVTDLYLQGRLDTGRSVHPVPSTQAEVDWVEASGAFLQHKRTKQCAWLKAV